MSTVNLKKTISANPLDRIQLSAYDRLRAEAAISRGEYIAELILEAGKALRSLFGSVKAKAQTGSTGRLSHTA